MLLFSVLVGMEREKMAEFEQIWKWDISQAPESISVCCGKMLICALLYRGGSGSFNELKLGKYTYSALKYFTVLCTLQYFDEQYFTVFQPPKQIRFPPNLLHRLGALKRCLVG